MSTFATLPFEEQLARIESAPGTTDALVLLREAGALADAEPLSRLLLALAATDELAPAIEPALGPILAALPDPSLQHVLSRSAGAPALEACLARVARTAFLEWPLARINALALLDDWLRRRAPVVHDELLQRAGEETREGAGDGRWLLFLEGQRLAELAEDPGSAATVAQTVEAVVEALARAPKSISQANAEELLARRVYADPGHFFFELLQNADDAGARHFLARVTRDRVEAIHDGEPFSFRDIVGVLSIGQTTKRLDQIGFFGVGFKSVYEISERPRIHSGAFDVEIAHVSIPRVLERSSRSGGDTVLILPFDKSEVDVDTLFSQAARIPPETLMTLPNLAGLSLLGPGGERAVWSETRDGERVTLREEVAGETRRYLAVAQTLRYDGTRDEGRPRESRVLVAIPLDADGAPSPATGPTLFSHLPTGERSGLRVLVHARFDVTVDRERLELDSPWNEALLTTAGRGLAEAARRLVGEDHAPLAVLPTETELAPVAAPLGRALREALRTSPCLRGAAGEWLRPPDSRLASTELAEALAGQELGDGARVLAPLDTREAEVALSLGARRLSDEELVAFLESGLARGEPRPDWLGPAVFEALANTEVEAARLAALPLLEDGAGRLVTPADARVAPALFARLYAGHRPLVAEVVVRALPRRLCERVRPSPYEARELLLDLRGDAPRGQDLRPALLAREDALLSALSELDDGLDVLDDVPILRDREGRRRAIDDGLVRLDARLERLGPLLAGHAPFVDDATADAHPALIQRWVPVFGLDALALALPSLDPSREESELLLSTLDEEAPRMSRALGRPFLEARIYADRSGALRALVGPERALRPSSAELERALPTWPWLEVPSRPLFENIGLTSVDASDVARAALGEAGLPAIPEADLPALYALLPRHLDELPLALVRRLVSAPFWLDARGRAWALGALRRGSESTHVSAFFEASGTRSLAHESTIRFAAALGLEHHLPESDHAAVIVDLLVAGAAPDVPRPILVAVIEEAAETLSADALTPLLGLALFEDEVGTKRRLASWTAPSATAAHRPGSYRAVLQAGALPLLAEEEERAWEHLLDAVGPSPAGLRELLARAAVDLEIIAEPERLRSLLRESPRELDEAERELIASLPIFEARSGRARRLSELAPSSRLVEVLGEAHVRALDLEDVLLDPDQEMLVRELGLAPMALGALLEERVLPLLRSGEQLSNQHAVFRSAERIAHLAGLAAELGSTLSSWPLAVDASESLVAPPRYRASEATRRLIGALPLHQKLADEAWASALPDAIEELAAPALSARRVAAALREACPEELDAATHPIVRDLDALYRWLRESADSIAADEGTRRALAGARVLPSAGGVLCAPSELVLNPDLPDVGLGWGLAEDVPADVARWLADTFELERAQRRTIVEHVLDGLKRATQEDDRARAAELVRFLAHTVDAGQVTPEELETLVRRMKIRARLEVPVEGGGWDKPRHLWLPSDEVASRVAAFATDLPPRVDRRDAASMDRPSHALLLACGAVADLDDATVARALDDEGVRASEGVRDSASRALARYVADRAVARPELIERWRLRKRAWAPGRDGRRRRPEALLWPDGLARALLGEEHPDLVDEELADGLDEEAAAKLGFRRAAALGLDEVAEHLGRRPASDVLLSWLEDGLREKRLATTDVREALRDVLVLVDDAGRPRRAPELARSGARELFGDRRGDFAAAARFSKLAKALGIKGRPTASMILEYVKEIARELDEISAEEQEKILRHLPECHARLGRIVEEGSEIRLPERAALAGLGRRGAVLVRTDDPRLLLLEPDSLADALPEAALSAIVDPMPTLERGPGLRRLLRNAGVSDLRDRFTPSALLPGPRVDERQEEARAVATQLRSVLGRARVGAEVRLVLSLSARGRLDLPGDHSPEVTAELEALVHDGTLFMSERALDDPSLLASALATGPREREPMRRWLDSGEWRELPRGVAKPARERPEPRERSRTGFLDRVRRFFERDEAAADHEPVATRTPRRASSKREKTPPRERDRAFFRADQGIAEQLEGGEGWVESRKQRPEFGFAFTPSQLPAPWLYAPKTVATRFDPRAQEWTVTPLARPEVRGDAGSIAMRGLLPDGEAILPVPLFGALDVLRVDGAEGRAVRGKSGETLVRLDDAAKVQLRFALGRLPDFEACTPADEAGALVSFVPDDELPDAVHEFLEELDLDVPAIARALEVRDFIRERYRYDPSYLEDPSVGRWLSRVTRGRTNRHIAALHAGADARHLGAGVCHELNTLACELLRRAGIPAAIATGWVLDGGALSEPDHLWALALLQDPSGAPVWAPIDAAATREGRPLRVPRRPPGRFRAPKDPKARAPRSPKVDLGGGRARSGRGSGSGGGRQPRAEKKTRARPKPARPPRAELLRLLHHLSRKTDRELTDDERHELVDALSDPEEARHLLARLLDD